MSKPRAKKRSKQQFMQEWWVLALLALTFLGVAYGFFSLAIDSGNFLQWLIGAFFVAWAFTEALRAVRVALAR